jgi:hypothetical protein
MEKTSRLSRVLLYQNLGFLAVILLCYMGELIRLTSLLFPDHPYSFQKSTVEMVLVFGVWFLVAGSTRRILNRIQYLERFLRVCAWCRRIDYKGQWMPLEEFMEQGFDTPTTHGICKDCLSEQQEALRRAREARQGQVGAA